jgi:hypothetical protein
MGENFAGESMPANTIAYNVTFRDFQFLQGYMARRIFAKNRQKYWPALLGVVLCAFFLVLAMLLSVNPYRAVALFGTSVRSAVFLFIGHRMLGGSNYMSDPCDQTPLEFTSNASIRERPAAGIN